MKKQVYDLEERLLEYTVKILKIVDQLPNAKASIKTAEKKQK